MPVRRKMRECWDTLEQQHRSWIKLMYLDEVYTMTRDHIHQSLVMLLSIFPFLIQIYVRCLFHVSRQSWKGSMLDVMGSGLFKSIVYTEAGKVLLLRKACFEQLKHESIQRSLASVPQTIILTLQQQAGLENGT